jgi:hypothetical protein
MEDEDSEQGITYFTFLLEETTVKNVLGNESRRKSQNKKRNRPFFLHIELICKGNILTRYFAFSVSMISQSSVPSLLYTTVNKMVKIWKPDILYRYQETASRANLNPFEAVVITDD